MPGGLDFTDDGAQVFPGAAGPVSGDFVPATYDTGYAGGPINVVGQIDYTSSTGSVLRDFVNVAAGGLVSALNRKINPVQSVQNGPAPSSPGKVQLGGLVGIGAVVLGGVLAFKLLLKR